jgi:SAM-dependent methyltransferase
MEPTEARVTPDVTVTAVLAGRRSAADPARLVKALLADLPANSEVLVALPDGFGLDALPGLATSDSRVEILEAPGARLAATRHAAATRARGEVLLFLEPPLELHDGWSEPLIEAALRPSCGVAGPALYATDGEAAPVGGLTFADAALNIAWLPPGITVHPVPAIAGCVMAMRRRSYLELGGFDTGASDAFHNLELCIRLWRCGLETLVVPQSHVAHEFAPAEAEMDWDDFIANLLRLATLHLEEPALSEATRSLSSHASFPVAAAHLLHSDAIERRQQLAGVCTDSGGDVLRDLCGAIFPGTRGANRMAAERAENGTVAAREVIVEAGSGDSPAGDAPVGDGATGDPVAGETGAPSGERRYTEVARRAWRHWSRQGIHASRPASDDEFADPRPRLDPLGWLPWGSFRNVLCLASAGGQQAPLFASLGYEVCSADLSPEQLELDRRVADSRGLRIETAELDMLDLSPLAGRQFDLVYQGISACYVPDVARLYREVAGVLAVGGHYYVEHWNPVQMQLEERGRWDGSAYRLVVPVEAGQPTIWQIPNDGEEPVEAWHFIHPLAKLVGSLPESGLLIRRLSERWPGDLSAAPGSEQHLAAFVPPFICILADRGPR